MRASLLPTSIPAFIPDRGELSAPPTRTAEDSSRAAALETFAISDEREDLAPEATHPRRFSGIGYIVGG